MNNSTVSGNTSQDNTVYEISSQEAIAILLWKIIAPILILIGTIGNVLSIIVLSRKSMRKSGASGYLICLAVSDLFVLITGLLRQWLVYQFDLDIQDLHPALCNVGAWLVYFSLDMSSWILVSVTVERAISVWKPHRVKVICTKKVFVINMLLLVVVLMLINGHFMLSLIFKVTELGGCECGCISRGYEKFQADIFPWIDLFLFSLGPFFCHVVGNAVIITGLVKSTRSVAKYYLENAEQRNTRQSQTSSMTKMLLCLNVIFLVSTLPVSVYFIISDSVWTSDDDPVKRLVYAGVNILMYVNNSTNFIAYIVSGRRFRSELYAIIQGRTLTTRPSFTLSITKSSLSRSQNLGSSRNSSTTL